jgi:AraC-like DNA-binding protein
MQDEPVLYWARYDTELFEGKFTSQIFPWHFHKAYTVIIIEEGSVSYIFQNEIIQVSAGEVLVINPYEAHYNRALDNLGWSYKVFFLPLSIFCPAEDKEYREFKRQLSSNADLVKNLINFHRLLKEPVSKQVYDSILDKVRELLIVHITSQIKKKNVNERVMPALDYIKTHLSEKMSNDKLAQLCLISKYHFQRLFKSCTGLTVRDYINQQRMEASLQLLRGDVKAGEVAYATGYFDQSHFHHQFKKMYGLTPKDFSR